MNGSVSRGVIAVIVLLCGSAQASVAEDNLAAGRAAADHFNFVKAFELARAGLSSGSARPDSAWKLYALLGESAASMGQIDRAVDAFVRALELHASLDIPPDASPKLWGPFQKALRQAAGQQLSLVPTLTREANTIHARVEIRGDVGRLVNGVWVYVQTKEGFAGTSLSRTEVFVGDFACGTPDCWHYFAVTDEFGNEIAWSGSPALPLRAPLTQKRSWAGRHWPQLLGAGIATGIAAIFAVGWLSAEGQLAHIRENPGTYTFAHAQSVDGTRHRNFRGSMISLSVGAAVLGTAFIW